jgi:hypothetical protein
MSGRPCQGWIGRKEILKLCSMNLIVCVMMWIMGKWDKKNWLQRKRGPLVPLGQVQPRTNWGEGRIIMACCVFMMHELVVVESSLIEKTMKTW